MKLLRDITAVDLESHPIWQLDAQSDGLASVTPAKVFESTNECGYIARTRFVTASGVVFPGYCSPQDPSGLDYIQPVMICGTNHVNLWDETAGENTNSEQVANALGMTAAEVFPIHYFCEVAFEGEHWEQVIAGHA